DPHAGWCGRGQGKPGRGLDGPSRLQRFTRGAPLGLPDGDYATAPAETTVRRSGPPPVTRSSLDCGEALGRLCSGRPYRQTVGIGRALGLGLASTRKWRRAVPAILTTDDRYHPAERPR